MRALQLRVDAAANANPKTDPLCIAKDKAQATWLAYGEVGAVRGEDGARGEALLPSLCLQLEKLGVLLWLYTLGETLGSLPYTAVHGLGAEPKENEGPSRLLPLPPM